ELAARCGAHEIVRTAGSRPVDRRPHGLRARERSEVLGAVVADVVERGGLILVARPLERERHLDMQHLVLEVRALAPVPLRALCHVEFLYGEVEDVRASGCRIPSDRRWTRAPPFRRALP